MSMGKIWIPAKAGIHPSATSRSDQWVPASAGTYQEPAAEVHGAAGVRS
jgi:hypothetical protein